MNPHSHLSPSTASQKWKLSSRIFHWVSALLMLLIWGLFVSYEQTDDQFFIDLHKAFGVSLLLWMVARIINRFINKSPPAVPMPMWQTALAHLTHYALYALLLAMPIAGILMTMYGGRSINMFGLFEIAPFVVADRTTARFYDNLHTGIIWTSLLVFTGIHIVAALFHHFVVKDSVLRRML